MTTLNEILLDSSSTLDLSASLPVGEELTLRQNYANQAVKDAASNGQFSEFTTEYTLYTTGSTNVPISGFRELELNPMVLSSGGWTEYPEIDIKDKYTASGNFCYVTGNPQSGYALQFSDTLTADMTLSVIYQRYPSGMPSLSSICELSEASYVTRKIESYVFYSRGDDKFPTAEARANTVLLNMVGREMKGAGGQSRDTKSKFSNPLG